MSQENVEIVRRAYEVINRGGADFSRVARLVVAEVL